MRVRQPECSVGSVLASLGLARAALRGDKVLLRVRVVNIRGPVFGDTAVAKALHIEVGREIFQGIVVLRGTRRRQLVLIGGERPGGVPFLGGPHHLFPRDVGVAGDEALDLVAGTPNDYTLCVRSAAAFKTTRQKRSSYYYYTSTWRDQGTLHASRGEAKVHAVQDGSDPDEPRSPYPPRSSD